MKIMILSSVLFLFVSTAQANVVTNFNVKEGPVSISKQKLPNGKTSYILTATSCAAYPGLAPAVKQISESSIIVKLKIFGPKCRVGQAPVIVAFNLGTFEHEIVDLGLDPKNVTIFFNL